MPYCPMPYHPMPYHPMPYHPMPYHPMPYHPMPYHPMPYRPMPYHPMPYHPMPVCPMPCCHVAGHIDRLPRHRRSLSLCHAPGAPQHQEWEGRKPSADLDARLMAIEEHVSRIAAENVTGVVREEVGQLGGQVESVQALQRARTEAGGNGTADMGGDWAVVLEARARDAEQRAAQLNETVGRLTAGMRKQAAEIAALKAAEQVAAGAAGLPKRPRGKMVVLEDEPSRWRPE
ncbi:unnamed protein product [Closterium sp. Naga37s-1]|nr:unnamed protein product [Closterium sp. Naga37s-1]